MVDDLEVQLARLAELLQQGGMHAFFASPLLTPEPRWFPEPWSPDLGAVRRVLLRLADYAGLEGLDVEVGLFDDERAEPGIPKRFAIERPVNGPAACFLGIEASTAWFGLERQTLAEPQLLGGVLAHEMAHAWRHRFGVQQEDRRLEEELTDLTTIVLGWGILTCNAAYRYSSSGTVQGVRTQLSWRHASAGYLSVDQMSALLAAYVVARGDDPAAVRRHLGPTQADLFEDERRRLDASALAAGLRLPPPEERPACRVQAAPPLEIGLSQEEAVVHEALAAVLAATGPGGGYCAVPVTFEAMPESTFHRPVATWGRADPAGGWTRRIQLVDDPAGAMLGLVLECRSADAFERFAFGAFDVETCANRHRFRDALAPWFRSARRDGWLFPAVPGFVVADTPSLLGDGELESLCRMGITAFEVRALESENLWLARFFDRASVRLQAEWSAGHGEPPGKPRDNEPRKGWFAPAADRVWWTLVTDPKQVQEEASHVGWVVADRTPGPAPHGPPPEE